MIEAESLIQTLVKTFSYGSVRRRLGIWVSDVLGASISSTLGFSWTMSRGKQDLTKVDEFEFKLFKDDVYSGGGD